MRIKARVEDRSRKRTPPFVSPGATETTRAWVNDSLAARAQEREEQTMRNIRVGLEATTHDLQIRRTAKEDES